MRQFRHLPHPPRFVDTRLNYGREVVAEFGSVIAPFRVALDLGAGPGADLCSLRSVCSEAHLHGVDVISDNQDTLRSYGFTAHSLDLERDPLPFEDEAVDLIVSNQVMEHLKDVFWVMHEISRCLAVGGHLIVGVPNLASLHNRILLMSGRQPTSINNSSAHLRGYTKGDMVRLMENGFPGGYECLAVRGANFYPFPRYPATWLARWFPTFAWGVFLLMKKTMPYDKGFLTWPVEASLETNFYVGR